MSVYWIEGVVLVLTILFAAMAAAAETALTALSPPVVNTLSDQGRVGRTIVYLKHEPNRFLSTILIVNSTSLIVASSVATLLFTSLWKAPWGEIAATVGISILVLIFSEITPKNIAVRRPRGVALLLALPVRFFSIVLSPVIALIGGIVSVLLRLLGQGGGNTPAPSVTEEELRSTLDLAEESREITPEEGDRIEGILNLDKIVVDQVMRPRVDIVAVPVDMPLMDALDVILREGHSRIPVYEGSPDRIVGVLYDKDLLKYIRENEVDVSLRDVARDAIFVPESKRADDLLREFQKQKVHMAIVVDEYGGTAGLVTIEDILEEIVGEIQDEYDQEAPLIVAEGERAWVVDAILRIDELNEDLGLDLVADNGIETLGGYVFERLGEVPEAGDSVQADHVRLEVVEIEGRRIKKVRVTQLAEEAGPLDETPE